MPVIINATNEKVSLQIAGNWFNWNPGQEKTIRNPSIARFIEMDRRGYGLAVLPDLTTEAEDIGDVEVSDEEVAIRKEARKALKEELCKHALDAYIQRLRAVIKNNQVSHQRDINRAGDKYDASVDLTDGELSAMRIVASYQRKDKDEAQARVDEAKKLMEQINGKK